MTHVSIKELTKVYPGATTPSLDRLSLEIPTGELTALLGPSGCGKTTTMKMIAGLLEPTSGDVTFDGRSVLRDKPEDRGVVMVFQNYLLFPYMSVADNVGFGLKMRKKDPAEIKRRVGEMLELVKLPDLGDRKPSALSGGQQQRVALARALIVQPNVLLLDEPLSNLDAHLRFEMRDLIRSLQQEIGITTIFVTHDQEEAVVLADRVALILDGQMKQYDRADVFYKRPIDEATARFFGGHNFIPGTSDGHVFDCALGKLSLPEGATTGVGKLTFRPENVRIGTAVDGQNSLTSTIADVIYLGTQTRLKLRVRDTDLDAVVNPNEIESYAIGDTLPIHLPHSTLWVI
ncbi:ABC transporter ATP-binding protein [uncultured Roseobacter sp.]|uniref:ABC transporter ATP-binding protein n=1 Tax=uncultured Roseobacter sp. TaxID=114847 RepID=UPI0026055E03|nr:ABC transporter ATP-binding protein [uncultured Roseobacter sp.]